MKRLHVHVSVQTSMLRSGSTRSCSQRTVVRKDDYAKWMLDDPRVNFAISQRDGKPGVQHLGIQVENRPSWQKCTNGCRTQTVPFSKRAIRSAVMPRVRRAGSTTRRGSSGKRS